MADPGLIVRIAGDASSLSKALDDSSGDLKLFGKAVDKGALTKLAGVAGAAGIAAVAIGTVTKAAADDRDEQRKLVAAYDAAGAARGNYTDEIDAAISAGAALAFSDTEIREGLEPLIRSTGDAAEANRQLTAAQDIARLANVSLAEASEAVAKANSGLDRGLIALLPGIEKGATASETLDNAMAAAAGQADAFAESTAGLSKRGTDAFGELAETIGGAFLPILDELLPALIPIIEALAELIEAVLPVLIPLMRVFASVLKSVLSVVQRIVRAITDLVAALGRGIDAVRRFLSNLGPLGSAIGGQSAGGVGASGLSASLSASGAGTTAATTTNGAVVINISGDPVSIQREVISALRTYSRRNGITITGL